MKSIKKYLFYVIILLTVFAIDKVDALESLSINKAEYELVCKYVDGLELTIARDDVYIQNASASIDASSSNGIKFFLTTNQRNSIKDSAGGMEYKHHAISANGKCPSKLFAYDLPLKYEQEESEDSEENNSVSTLYYSTFSDVAADIGGTREESDGWWLFKETEVVSNATRTGAMDTKLASEQVYLTAAKETTVCDYKILATGDVITAYLYSNLTILEVNGYLTTLDTVWSDCIKPTRQNEVKYIYVNDPFAKTVGTGLGKRYNAVRFYVGTSSTTCKNNNDGQACTKYQYLGTRNGLPGNGSIDQTVCKVLGDETVKQLQNIIEIMQILVPILMIALTGFDIGKLVLSGNLDEELPKKKTIIIVRFCLVIIFFFLPLITSLIINGLMDAGVVGVKEIDCVLN